MSVFNALIISILDTIEINLQRYLQILKKESDGILKNRFLKITAILLVFLMLMSLCISCKKTEEEEEGEETTVSTVEGETYRDDLPRDLNYTGADVNFVSRAHDWYKNEVTVESDNTDDIVNEAVYNREKDVEKRLGINIINTMLDDGGKTGEEAYARVTEQVKMDVTTGTGLYDIAINNMYHTMGVASEGFLYNLYDVPNIDLTKSYYSQNYNFKGTINGKLYTTTGDASLTFIKFAFVTFFNKEIANANKIPDLYQTVLDGNWTIGYQKELIAGLYDDIGTETDVKDEGDAYGLVMNPVTAIDPYWSSFDLSIISMDVEGKLFLDCDTAKASTVYNLIYDLVYINPDVYCAPHQSDDGEFATQAKMFANNQALFTTLRMASCEDANMRNMEAEYGIIPMPKWETGQDQYYSYCHDLFSVYGISAGVTADRLEMVGAAFECFFSESDQCRYNQFEVALKVKYQSDTSAGQMLDLVVDNVKIDTGWIYSKSVNKIDLIMRELITAKLSGVFKSKWDGNTIKYNNAIDALEAEFGIVD